MTLVRPEPRPTANRKQQGPWDYVVTDPTTRETLALLKGSVTGPAESSLNTDYQEVYCLFLKIKKSASLKENVFKKFHLTFACASLQRQVREVNHYFLPSEATTSFY